MMSFLRSIFGCRCHCPYCQASDSRREIERDVARSTAAELDEALTQLNDAWDCIGKGGPNNIERIAVDANEPALRRLDNLARRLRNGEVVRRGRGERG